MHYIAKVLDSKESASFGRLGSCAIITVWLIICGYLAFTKQQTIDIPLQWAGLAIMLFGVAKVGEVVTKPVPPAQGGQG